MPVHEFIDQSGLSARKRIEAFLVKLSLVADYARLLCTESGVSPGVDGIAMVLEDLVIEGQAAHAQVERETEVMYGQQ